MEPAQLRNKVNLARSRTPSFIRRRRPIRLCDCAKDAGRPEAGGVYQVRYTFGFSPLQQYLIEKEPGQIQVAPFAFDTRPESLGGQQWYHLDEKLGESRHPRLDWDQPLQSWNGMCADCHSTGVKRGFDPETNRFSTSLIGVAVECTACHVPHTTESGPSEEIIDESAGLMHGTAAIREEVGDSLGGRWVLGSTDHIASWVGEARSEQPMEQCYACHALRALCAMVSSLASRFLISSSPNCSVPLFTRKPGRSKKKCLFTVPSSRVGCVPPAFNVSIATTRTRRICALRVMRCARVVISLTCMNAKPSCASAFSECGMCGLPHARQDVYGRRLQAGSSVCSS